jgi:hypothetical protein
VSEEEEKEVVEEVEEEHPPTTATAWLHRLSTITWPNPPRWRKT